MEEMVVKQSIETKSRKVLIHNGLVACVVKRRDVACRSRFRPVVKGRIRAFFGGHTAALD